MRALPHARTLTGLTLRDPRIHTDDLLFVYTQKHVFKKALVIKIMIFI